MHRTILLLAFFAAAVEPSLTAASVNLLQTPSVADAPQSNEDREKAMAQRLNQLSTTSPGSSSPKPHGSGLSTRDIMPEAPEIFAADPQVKKEYGEALREYYAYRVTGYQHRKSVFDWQLFSSKFIFVTVLLLVFLGMYFAALQFHLGLKALKKGTPEEAGLKTELKATLSSIEVASPVLGVVILSLSLAFFYLYLVYVYPIQESF